MHLNVIAKPNTRLELSKTFIKQTGGQKKRSLLSARPQTDDDTHFLFAPWPIPEMLALPVTAVVRLLSINAHPGLNEIRASFL